MKLNVLALTAALVLFAGASAADARPSRDPAAEWNPFVHSASVASTKSQPVKAASQKRRKSYASRSRSERVQHAYASTTSYSSGSHSAGPRPRAWCGWWMRTQRGGGAHLNVAWNWSRWGSPSGPQVGAVVVWRHHVGEIVGQAANGKWLVRSGNDGGAVRTRARSVAGAVFRVG